MGAGDFDNRIETGRKAKPNARTQPGDCCLSHGDRRVEPRLRAVAGLTIMRPRIF